MIQILAGSDTTATTIRVVMLYLMSTPRAYRALQAEIDEGIRAGRISSPITSAEAQNMPYLQVSDRPPLPPAPIRISYSLAPFPFLQQAVIIETLRLFPPFTGLPFKAVPPQGDTIDGKHVPGGTLIAPNFWTTGRNRALFGEDAEVFRPERWLEADAAAAATGDRERRAEMRRVAELAFGYGRWGCAGKMIAFLELNKVFVEVSSLGLDPGVWGALMRFVLMNIPSQLLRQFDFQLVNPAQPWKSVNYNLFFQSDMWVSVALRETEAEK